MLVANKKSKNAKNGGRVYAHQQVKSANSQSKHNKETKEGQWQVVNRQKNKGHAAHGPGNDNLVTQSKQISKGSTVQIDSGEKVTVVKNTKGQDIMGGKNAMRNDSFRLLRRNNVNTFSVIETDDLIGIQTI